MKQARRASKKKTLNGSNLYKRYVNKREKEEII